ncbi:hypothetical protein SAMN05216228_104033 [Rhizobium tibeticum]|uniref:Uncharacterized protein n=1 Tax=Rhizobium tibeticum TaxID=501024 RepID=A0A1H8V9L2_9HYPH|nr:DUF6130 family protein [Rhizobium tibeticum]SEI18525.1 hypothetical protein RTCCBAU85039_5920 [Rhizobium tibeticum]SEP11984.1 hypothetical protein SAMN05216228_104033 [Rhizobium tibeticum]
MDAPLPEGLAQGVFRAQYRVETLHIVPVFGDGAVHASPRIGHLHVIVDDLPWWWAVDIAGLPPGEHNVKIALVDANHNDPFGVESGSALVCPHAVGAIARRVSTRPLSKGVLIPFYVHLDGHRLI